MISEVRTQLSSWHSPILILLSIVALAPAQTPPKTSSSSTSSSKAKPRPDYPPFSEVAKGYTKVISTMDGKPGLYTIWIRKKDNQMLAELPRSYATVKQFIALTVSSGERYAGLQAGERSPGGTWR